MNRFHVHLHVDDLAKSVGFYSKLFATEPARLEGDYAKWMLEDPPVNFAISTRGTQPGIDHLGIQTDDPAELDALKARAEAAAQASTGSACCAPELAVAASTEPAACCAPTPRGKPIGVPIKSSTSCC